MERSVVAWRNALFTIFALHGFTLANWIARIPAVRDDLGLSFSGVGILLFWMSAASLAALATTAWLIARLGPRGSILLSLLVAPSGLLLVGVGTAAGSAVLVAVGLVLYGLAKGAGGVMINVDAAAAERALGKTVMPLMHAFFSVGTVGGAGIGALAAAVGIPVGWHLGVIAVLAAITALIAVRFLPAGLEAPVRTSASSSADSPSEAAAGSPAEPSSGRAVAPSPARPGIRRRAVGWVDRRLMLIGAVGVGMAFAESSANDWLALASIDGHGFSNSTGALMFTVFTVAMTLGRAVGGPLIDRFGRVVVLRASAAASGAGVLLFILGPAEGLIVAGTALWGLGVALGMPMAMSAAAADAARAPARVSFLAMLGNSAFLVGPPVIAMIGEAVGLLNALYLVLALLLLAGFTGSAVRETREPARNRVPLPE